MITITRRTKTEGEKSVLEVFRGPRFQGELMNGNTIQVEIPTGRPCGLVFKGGGNTVNYQLEFSAGSSPRLLVWFVPHPSIRGALELRIECG